MCVEIFQIMCMAKQKISSSFLTMGGNRRREISIICNCFMRVIPEIYFFSYYVVYMQIYRAAQNIFFPHLCMAIAEIEFSKLLTYASLILLNGAFLL